MTDRVPARHAASGVGAPRDRRSTPPRGAGPLAGALPRALAGALAGALALTLAASAAAAQTPTAVAASAPGAELPSLKVEKYTLPNGLEVILHEDRSVPIAVVDTWYKVGSGDEKPGRTGFAHLFEHIMFMGSEHVPVGAFDQWLEAAGVNNNGSTSTDRTNYYEIGPSNALPLALWLDADRLGFLLPTMDQKKLDLQRDVVKNERRQRVDNVPYGRAFETVLAALYPSGHPYSWPVIGSMADLSAATLEDVTQFFRTYYAPNNATIVIAGSFDRDSAKTWVQRWFGDVPRGPALPPRPTPAPVRLTKDTVLVLEDRVQLPRFWYTWPSVKSYASDDAALDVLGYVLAGDKSSRLYKRLVYETQVAQSVSAFQDGSRMAGVFMLDVTPKPGQSPARVAAMAEEELTKVQREGITDRELARAKNSIRAGFLDRLAGVLGKAELINGYNYFVGTPDWVRQDAARYDALTTADVQRVARQYLAQPKVVLTVVPEGQQAMALRAGATPATPAAGVRP